MDAKQTIFIAIPKGRILKPALRVLKKIGIYPDSSFYSEGERKLQFSTNVENDSLKYYSISNITENDLEYLAKMMRKRTIEEYEYFFGV